MTSRAPACADPAVRAVRRRTADLQQNVEALPAKCDVLLRVVDDAIGAERPRLLDVARAADRGDVTGAERLRDLHGERADTPGRSVDEDALSGLQPRLVTETLQRGDRRDRNGRGLLEAQPLRLAHDGVLHAHVLGERARSATVDLVARRDVRDVLPDRLDDAGEVHAQPRILRRAEARPEPCDGQARHPVPVGRVHRRGADAHEHLVVRGDGRVGLDELEHVRRAVAAVVDGPHDTVTTTLPVFCQLSTYRVASTIVLDGIDAVDDGAVRALPRAAPAEGARLRA